MRRLMMAAAAAFLLVLTSPASLPANTSIHARWWVSASPGETAQITSCPTGNSAVIFGAQEVLLGTNITGRTNYCMEEPAIYFGLEFFNSAAPTAGYFLQGLVAGSSGTSVDFSFTGSNFTNVTAVCVSAAPNDRLACARVSIDGKTGAVSLTPISVGDPLVSSASGPMYFCEPGDQHIDPTCVTCL